jgi:hypothetical protein
MATIRYRSRGPSFSGKHNRIKLAAWSALYGVRKGMIVSELAAATGSERHSIGTLLCRWTRWRYLLRTDTPFGYSYRLSARGRHWLERWAGAPKDSETARTDETTEVQR